MRGRCTSSKKASPVRNGLRFALLKSSKAVSSACTLKAMPLHHCCARSPDQPTVGSRQRGWQAHKAGLSERFQFGSSGMRAGQPLCLFRHGEYLQEEDLRIRLNCLRGIRLTGFLPCLCTGGRHCHRSHDRTRNQESGRVRSWQVAGASRCM